MKIIPEHDYPCERIKTDAGCYHCCDACNYDRHTCPGCGTPLTHLGNERVYVDGVLTGQVIKHEGCVD